jgi:hypothetical protein
LAAVEERREDRAVVAGDSPPVGDNIAAEGDIPRVVAGTAAEIQDNPLVVVEDRHLEAVGTFRAVGAILQVAEDREPVAVSVFPLVVLLVAPRGVGQFWAVVIVSGRGWTQGSQTSPHNDIAQFATLVGAQPYDSTPIQIFLEAAKHQGFSTEDVENFQL